MTKEKHTFQYLVNCIYYCMGSIVLKMGEFRVIYDFQQGIPKWNWNWMRTWNIPLMLCHPLDPLRAFGGLMLAEFSWSLSSISPAPQHMEVCYFCLPKIWEFINYIEVKNFEIWSWYIKLIIFTASWITEYRSTQLFKLWLFFLTCQIKIPNTLAETVLSSETIEH